MPKNAEQPVTLLTIPQKVAINCCFPPLPQNAPLSVDLGGGWIWTTGCADGLQARLNQRPAQNKGLDIRHFDLLALIARACRVNVMQWGIAQQDEKHRWNIGFTGILKQLGMEKGGKQVRYIQGLLSDLYITNMSVRTPKGKVTVFRAIERLDFHETDDGGLVLDYLRISDELITLLAQIEDFVGFRLDQMRRLPSVVARSIYLYLPSRAIHHTERSPFAITLSALLQELRMPVPASKSLRKKIFTQNKHSVIAQLNGAELPNELVLRCDIRECKDGKDYKFCAWVEKPAARIAGNSASADSRLLDWWLSADRPESDFYAAVSAKKELAPYIVSALASCGIDVNGSRVFLEMAAALLASSGADFEELAGTMKQLALEGRIRAPFPYLCTMIKNGFKQAGAQLDLL